MDVTAHNITMDLNATRRDWRRLNEAQRLYRETHHDVVKEASKRDYEIRKAKEALDPEGTEAKRLVRNEKRKATREALRLLKPKPVKQPHIVVERTPEEQEVYETTKSEKVKPKPFKQPRIVVERTPEEQEVYETTKEQKRLERNAKKRIYQQENKDKVKAYHTKYNDKRSAIEKAKSLAMKEAWENSPTPNPSWLTKPAMVWRK